MAGTPGLAAVIASPLWLNGALVAAEAARIDPADRGFTLGDGLFETMRLVAGVPAHLDRHLARLAAGASELGIGHTWDVRAGVLALCGAVPAEGVVRITLTRGPAARGLAAIAPAPTLLIGWSPPVAQVGPVAAIVCQCTRRNQASPLSRLKTLNYLDGILAAREAQALGAEEAILLNTDGAVAEATAANVFALIDGRLLTPPVADGALPGIARALLLEHGAIEARLSAADLHRAEAVVLSNSLGVRELKGLGDTKYQTGKSFFEKKDQKTLGLSQIR